MCMLFSDKKTNFLASGKWSEAEDFPQIVHAF